MMTLLRKAVEHRKDFIISLLLNTEYPITPSGRHLYSLPLEDLETLHKENMQFIKRKEQHVN